MAACRIVQGLEKGTKIDVQVMVFNQQLFLRSAQAVKWFSVYVFYVHGVVEFYTVECFLLLVLGACGLFEITRLLK